MNLSPMPLVSVCISSFEQSAFLKEALDSVLMQDYPHLEILIVDDGSSDSSQELIRSFAKVDNRIRYLIHEVNQGVTKTYNTLLSHAKGDYIVRHDGDDLMLPGKISAQVRFMESNPAYAAVYHNLELFESQSGNSLGYFVSQKRRIFEGGLKEVIRYGCFFSGAFTMFRRKFISGIEFNFHVESVGDYLFMVNALQKTPEGRIGYLPEVYGRYRRHQTNITNSKMRLMQDTLKACFLIVLRQPFAIPLVILRLCSAGSALLNSRNSLDH